MSSLDIRIPFRAASISALETEVGTGVELQPLRDDPPNEKVVKGPAPLSDDFGQRPEDLQLRGAESKTNRRTISDTAQVGGKVRQN